MSKWFDTRWWIAAKLLPLLLTNEQWQNCLCVCQNLKENLIEAYAFPFEGSHRWWNTGWHRRRGDLMSSQFRINCKLYLPSSEHEASGDSSYQWHSHWTHYFKSLGSFFKEDSMEQGVNVVITEKICSIYNLSTLEWVILECFGNITVDFHFNGIYQ